MRSSLKRRKIGNTRDRRVSVALRLVYALNFVFLIVNGDEQRRMHRALQRAQVILNQIRMSSSSTTPALASFSTCELSDALIKLGLPHGGHLPDVHRASSYPGASDERLCGPAYTVRMVLSSDESAPRLQQHFVDTAEDGSVMLISAPPREFDIDYI